MAFKTQVQVISLGLILVGLTGCAIHYSDTRSGVEHIWGLGQLRMVHGPTQDMAHPPFTNNLTALTTGVGIPGFCLETGRDHFGFSFGYLNRQRLAVVNKDAITNTLPPVTTPQFASICKTNAVWAIGHIRMRSVPSPTHHYAIITGKALAGLGASLGSQDNSLGLVLDGKQKAVVLDNNIALQMDQDAPRWPGFDLFNIQVKSSVANNPTQNNLKEKP